MASMIRQPGMGMGGGTGSQDERSCRGLQRGPRYLAHLGHLALSLDLKLGLPHVHVLSWSSPLVALWQACFGPSIR